MYNARHDLTDSPTASRDMMSPFGGANPKQSLRERFAAAGNGSSNLNVPEYAQNGTGSASSSHRTQAMVEKYGGMGGNKYRKEGSSLNMAREESDMSLTNGKYESVEQRAMDEGVSPEAKKRKTNVHLQPMNHLASKIQPMGMQMNDPSMGQSESNPILNAPAPVNARVKLAELSHIPSVKSNLMS